MTAALARRPVAAPAPGLSRPRSDGRRVLFEVMVDGLVVPCGISQHALRDIVSGGRRHGSGDLMDCFVKARPRIEALALRKIRARRAAPQGVLYIWTEDAEEMPAPVAPAQQQPEDEGAATMAKGQKRNNREAKKPKTAVKPLNPAAAPTFLRPGAPAAAPAGGGSFRSGKR